MNSSSSKRKITQNDLRQLMIEKKRKLQQDHTTRKIESPLAKYQPDGTLLCIICNSAVKNEALWSVHINAKQHKDNIDRKKMSIRQEVKVTAKPLKRPVPIVPTQPSHSPPKKIKGILKNKIEPSTSLSQIQVVKPARNLQINHGNQMEVDNDSSVEVDLKDEDLPEGFFDDPVLDAKARNVDYKDPQNDEWEKFQRAIREENNVSSQIQQDEEEESNTERQIEEIDEQLYNWSRVLSLEVKKEQVQEAVVEMQQHNSNMKDDDGDSSYGSEEEFDEYLNWRSKSSFK